MTVPPIVQPPDSAPAVGLGAAELTQQEMLDGGPGGSGRNNAASAAGTSSRSSASGPPSTWACTGSRGRHRDGEQVPWSVVVKVLQSYRYVRLPPQLRAAAAVDQSWRHQADLYRAGVADICRPGCGCPTCTGSMISVMIASPCGSRTCR